MTIEAQPPGEDVSSETAQIIEGSLDRLVERAGDPSSEVYRRMFAEYPQTEPRFVRDVSGEIRAEMLTMIFQCLMDPDGPYQLNLVRAERVNHDGFGTPSDEFDRFFGIVHETCRDLSGPGWTDEVEAAWARQISLVLTRTA